jgi:hypothetical protein
MHTTTDNLARPRSVLTRLPFWSRLYRYPRVGMAVFITSGSWNLFLGVLMLGYGFWLGLLPLVSSAVLFLAGTRAYQVAQSQRAAPATGVHGR